METCKILKNPVASFKIVICQAAFALFVMCPGTIFSDIGSGNLIEYSTGSFGCEGGSLPMMYPPMVKIYNDGTIVFFRDDAYWIGQLKENRLLHLKKKLSEMRLLACDRFLPVKDGYSPHWFGGGIAYIRYLDGDEEKIIACNRIPKKGNWGKIIRMIYDSIPNYARLFVPPKIVVSLSRSDYMLEGDPPPNVPEWPFKDKQSIATGAWFEEREVNDHGIIAYLFNPPAVGFSFLSWSFKQDGHVYSIFLRDVPGWFDETALSIQLETMQLAYDELRKKNNGVVPDCLLGEEEADSEKEITKHAP